MVTPAVTPSGRSSVQGVREGIGETVKRVQILTNAKHQMDVTRMQSVPTHQAATRVHAMPALQETGGRVESMAVGVRGADGPSQ